MELLLRCEFLSEIFLLVDKVWLSLLWPPFFCISLLFRFLEVMNVILKSFKNRFWEWHHILKFIKELILKKARESEIKLVARKEGMRTLREDGVAKVLEGVTSLEEILRVTVADEWNRRSCIVRASEASREPFNFAQDMLLDSAFGLARRIQN